MAEAATAVAVTPIASTPIENTNMKSSSDDGHSKGKEIVPTSFVKSEVLADTVGKKVPKMTSEIFSGYEEDAGKGSHTIAIKKVFNAIAL